MLNSSAVKWRISLALVVLIVAVGITFAIDNPAVTPPAAIGQTADVEFTADHDLLQRINQAFIEVVKQARPAIVQITTTRLARQTRDPFEEFFRFPFRERPRSEEQAPEEQIVPGGLGSGVIVSEDGYILTNNHVIAGAEDITVILPNGRQYPAKVVGVDAGEDGTDVAVLKIDGQNLPHLRFGDSDALQVGEWVIAIGSPFGLAQTVTRGTVSAKGRTNADIGVVQYADFIQTDAAINRGNSGGALINIRGELIGINTAIATGGGFSQGNVGVGFAIPINLARTIMTQLIEKGEVVRGWLGVRLQEVDYNLAEKFELDGPRGAVILMVGKGSPAEEAGLQQGDLVLSLDGTPVRDVNHLQNLVAAAGVDKTVELKVLRKGKEQTLRVRLGKRTQDTLASLSQEVSPAFAGLRVQTLTGDLAERFNHQGERGVLVVSVERRSPAEKAGIKTGDLIQEIEEVEIATLEDYQKQLEKVKNLAKVLMFVRHSNGTPELVIVEIPKNDR